MMTDMVSDALTRIRNSQRAGHKTATLMNSKAVVALLEVLKNEGFIQDFQNCECAETNHPRIEVTLKYYSNGQPLISEATRLSKPGRRVYSKAKDIPMVVSGLGIVVVSTSQGLLTDKQARSQGLGGELVASIG